MIWTNNKRPEGVIFLDKEHGFRIEPDIIADNMKLPFRLNFVFSSIIFDPPWGINMPPWWLNKKTREGSGGIHYFGDFKSKRELIVYIHRAQQEFQRYTKRLCFKWGERNISLWNILPLFTKSGWKEIHRREIKANRNVGGKSSNKNWWVVLTFGGKRS